MALLHKNKLCNQKGVTLIEVLISVALLGIITTVFIQILNSSIVLRSKSDIQAEASAIAMSHIEALKRDGVVPVNLVQTETEKGYEVVTTLTDVTNSLGLSADPINQTDNSPFTNPFLSLSLGTALSLSGPINQNTALASAFDKTIQLNVSEDATSAKPIQYQLTYNAPDGTKTIALGSFERLNTGVRAIKIVRLPELQGSVTLRINDSTHEPLQIGIFEDKLNQITVLPIGTDTAIQVVQNLSEQGDPNLLNRKYFEILVTVSKNGQTYARLLSTWTVKGD